MDAARRLCISVAPPSRLSGEACVVFSCFSPLFSHSFFLSFLLPRVRRIAFILALNRGCESRYATSIMMYRRDERDGAQYGKAMAPRLRRKNRPINRPISSSATYRAGGEKKDSNRLPPPFSLSLSLALLSERKRDLKYIYIAIAAEE